MGNIIVSIIIVAIIVGALAIIYSEKKKGAKCIGCPYNKVNGEGCCSWNERK